MRTIARGLALAVLGLALHVPAQAQDSRFDPRHLTTPPLRAVHPVHPERFTLPNGAVVFLLEDHTLPVVTGTAYFRSSPALVSDSLVGIASLTGEVMRSGGTATHPGDALDDRLAAIGASVSTSLGADQGYGGFRCLTENTDEVVRLLADVLRRPAFPEDKIQLAKVELRQSIASRNDEPIPIAIRVARQAVYGKGSPWAREPEYATVEAITRADCVRLHDRVFVPERMVLAVYGDFRSATLKALLTAAFRDWRRSGTPTPQLPPIPARAPHRLFFADKEDVTQSTLLVAGIGHRIDDPDHAAMSVVEQALGGGSSSRLFRLIRTERGLAYATGAEAGADYLRPGMLIAYTLTRNDSAMTALALLRDQVDLVTRAPFQDEEFRVAKESVQNQFVFNFEQRSDVLFRTAYYQMLGYPLDFLERYQHAIEAVTPASAFEAARSRIHPDELAVVVVGKEKEFDRPLAEAGLPLERVDISIPPPPSRMGAVALAADASDRGRAWLERAAEAAGGAAAWGAAHSLITARTLTVSMAGQSIGLTDSTVWVLPDRRLDVQRSPAGEIRQGFDGAAGWVSMMGQVQAQPRLAEEIRDDYERSLFHLFGHPSELEVQALGEPQSVDGVRCDVAIVKSDRVRDWMLFFDPDGRLARMEYTGDGPQGAPARVTEVLGDWQAAGAIRFPRAVRVLMDGKPFMEGRVTRVSLDAAVPDGTFQRP